MLKMISHEGRGTTQHNHLVRRHLVYNYYNCQLVYKFTPAIKEEMFNNVFFLIKIKNVVFVSHVV